MAKKRAAKRTVDKRNKPKTIAQREAISAAARARSNEELARLEAEAAKATAFEKEHGRKFAGDYLEDLFKVTGVKALVDMLTDDCGCEDRKLALNSFHEDLSQRFNKSEKLNIIYDAYEGIFGDKVAPKNRKSQCAPCHKKKMKKIRHWFMRKKMEQGIE